MYKKSFFIASKFNQFLGQSVKHFFLSKQCYIWKLKLFYSYFICRFLAILSISCHTLKAVHTDFIIYIIADIFKNFAPWRPPLSILGQVTPIISNIKTTFLFSGQPFTFYLVWQPLHIPMTFYLFRQHFTGNFHLTFLNNTLYFL